MQINLGVHNGIPSALLGIWLVANACGAPATPPAPVGRAPARVMSFNIRYGTASDGANSWRRRKRLVYRIIKRYRPDIIGLQEALRFQIDQIHDAAPGYGEVGVGRDNGDTRGEHAAILYRTDMFRADTSGTFWLSNTPDTPGSCHWGNRHARICTWVRLIHRETGRALYVYNTHLDHWSARSRRRGARLLARTIQRCRGDDPVVVTGDFNAGENSRVVRYLTAGDPAGPDNDRAPIRLIDTYRARHKDKPFAGTFNWFRGVRGGRKIDFILASANTDVAEAAIIRDHFDGRYPSDHFPVTARLLF
jgi:endonuclease/exonuclease/phosphatase family metal-dependent hydrolase